MIPDNFDEAFRKLVLEGRTVVAIRHEMADLGFDMRHYSAMELLQKMVGIVTEARAQGANNGE